MVGEPGPASAKTVQTILVVEDEVLIRLDVADYLRECGYHVLEASNAAEAVTVLQTDHNVDLIFSDVQMPGAMDGFGLAKWIRANRPDLKIVLTSGVVRSAELAGDLCEDGPVEEKPYHPQRLLERIRGSLAQARRATHKAPDPTEPKVSRGRSASGG